MYQMHDKIAVITGGGSGIGRAASRVLSEYGATVFVADINLEHANAVARMINDVGGNAHAVHCDIGSQESIHSLFQTIQARYDRIDYAIHNAGITGPIASIADYPLKAARDIFSVNLTGAFICMQEALKMMIPRRRGAIVNTSSIWGLTAGANYAAYTASKHGVVGLTKAAALETAQLGIRVNAICPGFTETPLLTEQGLKLKPGTAEFEAAGNAQPMGRLGQPEEMAQAIAWLCSDASSFVTGHCLSVDGGFIAR
ncbi:SDR family NAD(P)-dependent oxidoreductase [Paraburkholderia tropica]|uniref:SDR family NAD(P)-dependent oxidoreductase n=1 Tax=Paraburkholderia tropica TaxID=92647 RepID=UPI00159102EB|nr:SDR family NAD(P)-dependent oxidoreductase [Paraburkholderia tropica]